MDKLRREAERSGDLVRFALELRRQGQSVRAKRLLQDLAWDEIEGAEDALNTVFPICPEMEYDLSVLESPQRDSQSFPMFLGSLDPRVYRRLEPVCQEILRNPPSLSIDCYQYELWLDACHSRSLLPRLVDEEMHFGHRLTWADPFEDELDVILRNALAIRDTLGDDEYARLGDLTLGWQIERTGNPDQSRSWAEGFNPRSWREEWARAEALGKTDFFKGPGAVHPPWLTKIYCPSRVVDTYSFALKRDLFFHRDHFRSQIQQGYHLILIELRNVKESLRVNSRRNYLQLKFAYVSAWQERVGDRVLCWSDTEFLIVWEFGGIRALVQELGTIRGRSREFVDEGTGTVSVGACEIKGDLIGAVYTCRDLVQEAGRRGRGAMIADEC